MKIYNRQKPKKLWKKLWDMRYRYMCGAIGVNYGMTLLPNIINIFDPLIKKPSIDLFSAKNIFFGFSGGVVMGDTVIPVSVDIV